ncbi:MAG: cobalt transporter [Clostridia bacterium]|nr:cobalt transporter [Clostridia bacterium]
MKILDMTEKEAKQYFLKSSSYCSLDLPKYFDFSNLLSFVDTEIKKKQLSKTTLKKSRFVG